jgi:hypothetical protein
VKGDSIPWVVQVEGKFVGGLELAESLTVERGTLASLRDLRLLWIHSPSSGGVLLLRTGTTRLWLGGTFILCSGLHIS